MRPALLLLLARPVLSACATTTPPTAASPLVGPEWRLEDLLGGGIIDNSHVTLTLAEDGRLSGSGGCNGFFGAWTKAAGGKLALGKMGATMKACAPALMHQEGKYLRALETASAYSFTPDGALLVTTAQGPLTFRKD